MDKLRAKQIIDAEEKIDVFYQDTPVWLEGVSDNSIAEVVSLKGNKARIEIPVNMLEERIR